MKQDPNLEFRPFPTSSWRVRIKQTLQKTKQQLCARQSKGAPPPWYAAKGSEAPLHQTISNKGSGDKTTFYVFSRTNGLFVQSKKRLFVQLHFWSCVAFCTRQVPYELTERKVLYTPHPHPKKKERAGGLFTTGCLLKLQFHPPTLPQPQLFYEVGRRGQTFSSMCARLNCKL